MNYITAAQSLADAGVDFVIIGGWSAILQGSATTTNDLDVCYSRERDNLKNLVRPWCRSIPAFETCPKNGPSFRTRSR